MQRAAVLLMVLVAAVGAGCRTPEAERRASERATAEAEEKAEATTLTGASLDPDGASGAASIAAFRLEQADYRVRLQLALDILDRDLAQATARSPEKNRELRARRELLKSDLALVERSTEQDWATMRTKLDRDLSGVSR